MKALNIGIFKPLPYIHRMNIKHFFLFSPHFYSLYITLFIKMNIQYAVKKKHNSTKLESIFFSRLWEIQFGASWRIHRPVHY